MIMLFTWICSRIIIKKINILYIYNAFLLKIYLLVYKIKNLKRCKTVKTKNFKNKIKSLYLQKRIQCISTLN